MPHLASVSIHSNLGFESFLLGNHCRAFSRHCSRLGLQSKGGPKRNAKAQVIGVDNEPIPGLYSAGDLGSIWGSIYQGSSNIAECLVFGRIAARQALKNH